MTTEAENLATAGRIYEAFGKGDVPAILAELADDVQWESWADNRAQAAGISYLQPRQGKQGAAAFFGLAAQMNVTEVQVLNLMAGGNSVAVEFVISASNPETGKTYRDEEIHLWTFNDAGRVTRLRHYVDTAKHIEAAKG